LGRNFQTFLRLCTCDNLNRLLTRTCTDGGVEKYVGTRTVVGATSYTLQLGSSSPFKNVFFAAWGHAAYKIS